MKLPHLLATVIVMGFLTFALVLGCSEQPPTSVGDGEQGLQNAIDGSDDVGITKTKRKTAKKKTYRAPLSGENEVPPVITEASGRAFFLHQSQRDYLRFVVLAHTIDGVTQAHVHLGPAGENGPVVAFLFLAETGGNGLINGALSQGVITEADLLGPLAGAPLDDLIAHMEAGNTYVNVHSLEFPPGEIRGQIEKFDGEPTRKKKAARKERPKKKAARKK